MKRALALLLLAGASTACGPKPASQVSMKRQPVDVVFGDQRRATTTVPTPRLVPAANPIPDFPTFLQPPVPPPAPPAAGGGAQPSTPTTALRTACPDGPAGPGIKELAPSRTVRRPIDASYEFVTTGTRTNTLPARPARDLSTRTVRSIGNVHTADPGANGAGAFEFDEAEVGGGVTVVTTYLSTPDGGPNGIPAAGLHLRQIVGTAANGGRDVFAPTSPLLLLPYPALEGATWSSAATDPRTQVTMAVQGTVEARKRFSLCGEAVDSWQAAVTGRIAGPGRVVTIDRSAYNVATQYGAVILRAEEQLSGYDANGQYTSNRTSMITREPARAR